MIEKCRLICSSKNDGYHRSFQCNCKHKWHSAFETAVFSNTEKPVSKANNSRRAGGEPTSGTVETLFHLPPFPSQHSYVVVPDPFRPFSFLAGSECWWIVSADKEYI
jgi:hypothetical protein